MSFTISRLYYLPSFYKKKETKNIHGKHVEYSFLQEKNIYIYRWHVDILKGNYIRKSNMVVKKTYFKF